jgi:hypothetical protein
MELRRGRLTMAKSMFGVALIAASLGSYIAGRRAGYLEGCRRPPNYAQSRALAFTKSLSVRSAEELCAVFDVAVQIEAGNPGFLARKPRVRASPSGGNPYSALHWTVTFTEPGSSSSLSATTQVDRASVVKYETAEASF